MSLLKNDHSLFINGAVGSTFYESVRRELVTFNQTLEPGGAVRPWPINPQNVRDWIWRMGPHVANPVRVVRDWEHYLRLVNHAAPPIAPVTLGRWLENGWYGDYAKWMFPFFTASRRRDALDWNVSRGLTHIISGASEADMWSNSLVTPRRFRWWESDANRDFMQASLIETRDTGLFPILTVFEHTSVPLDDATAIARAQLLVDLTHKWVPLYILNWELDERLPSRERWRFEKLLCERVNWRGRDLGNHYARPLEGSGVDVYDGLREHWVRGGNDQGGAHVVRLYQSNRNAGVVELEDDAHKVGEVARRTGTDCAAFEMSGDDPAIGNTYTEAEANQRARVVHTAMLEELNGDKRRTGSMNGVVAA